MMNHLSTADTRYATRLGESPSGCITVGSREGPSVEIAAASSSLMAGAYSWTVESEDRMGGHVHPE